MKRTALAIAIGAICAGLSGGVLAQEENQNDTDQMTQDQGNNDETRDITVDQEPAEIDVEQESPDITVDQAQPEVTITQPEPDVTVEEAEPDVTVEQTGEPDVTVEEAEDAEVDINQDEDAQDQERQQRDQAEQDNQTDQNNQENSLMSHQVSDLEGMTVMNQEDEEIGDVQHIAKHDESGDLFAIVSVGGIWGFGATDIALPLNNMQFDNDQLVVNTSYGEDEIEDSSNDYQEDEYSEVDGNMTLSEAQQQ
ncbi:hypothetical protein DQ400_11480 [Vreelandella sulfidaeris]|uniref:PRC-barrel domain-containing protein n=1 Tax=Vreelandella sulfidaeris TaxID=115553 RepID=A0A365TMC3_9GAMM|nr:PRC-barrel domain-containing protein [Halomonas sulfidaeris]RBI66829.1 hypothetical protein DQ400_11480 [Halomonas sulfidaeris]